LIAQAVGQFDMKRDRRTAMALVSKLIGCALGFSSVMTVAGAQQHHSYVADANREYASIFSRPENPCPTEQTTAGYGDCIGSAVDFTELHLGKFLIAVRGIASQDDAGARSSAAPGKVSELGLIDKADSAWREYRKNVCELMAAGMAGGSGEGNTAAGCKYKMDRQYAQQLADAVYLKILAE
jgi:uncharacterized protein YecT (DUF1311 family)